MPGWAVAYLAVLVLAAGGAAGLQLRRGVRLPWVVGNLLAALGLVVLTLVNWTPPLAAALGRGTLILFVATFGWLVVSTARDFLELHRDPELAGHVTPRLEWVIVLLTAGFYAPAAALGALAVQRAWGGAG